VVTDLSKPDFILYRRVSTKSQGASGLGLDSQLAEIKCYLASQTEYTVIADLVEVQSGKSDKNRPVLQEALEMASRKGAVILVSRLCRLSRDLEFVAALMKSKVQFRIATNPSADELSIGIYAVMGMHERKLIGIRTKAALAAAKVRGVKLGTAGSQNIKKANEARILAAEEFALKIKPVLEPLRVAGKTYQEIADILNKMRIRTPQGKTFYPASVRNYAIRINRSRI
jgi:DNA invertase Pin-like site-specific DNA recombinase